jgi:NAD(P) transhydrogenase
LIVDAVLVATGRKRNSEKLDLAAAGVTANERGLIRVNEHLQTDVLHIYAAEDALGFPAPASTGMQQGRLAMKHTFGAHVSSAGFHLLPTRIYTFQKLVWSVIRRRASSKGPKLGR